MNKSLLFLAAVLLAAPLVAQHPPAGQVTGVVLDPSGRPVGRAVVALRYKFPIASSDVINQEPAVLTADDGTFALDVPEWNDRLRVLGFKLGFAPTESPLVSAAASKVTIRLEPGSVVTYEVAAGAKPVEGARICYAETSSYLQDEGQRKLLVEYPEFRTCASTGAEGRAELHLRPGRYFVGVSARGYQWQLQELAVDERESVQRAALLPANDVRGRVVRADGTPVADVELRMSGPGSSGSTPINSGADGSFTFTDLLPGAFRVVVRKDDELLLQSVEVTVPTSRPLEIRLPRSGTLHVRFVEGDTHAPLAPSRAEIRNVKTLVSRPIVEPQSAELTLPNVPEGEYSIRATAADHTESEVRVQVAAGTNADAVDVPLGRGRTISGVVLDGGKPVAEANVFFVPDDPPKDALDWRLRLGQRADADGRFALRGLVPQKGALHVAATGYRRQVLPMDPTGDATGLVIRLERGAVVKGLLTRKGVPVPHSALSFVAVDTAVQLSETVLTDDRGAFELRGITTGLYRITADEDAGIRLLGEMKIEANAPLLIELEGQPGAVTGVVRGIAPDERSGAQVKVHSREEKAAPVQADQTYRLTDVAPGEARIWIEVQTPAWQRGCGFEPILIAAGETTTLDLDCSADLEITGRVTLGPTPVAHPKLEFEERDQALRITARGDATGNYRVRLRKGSYTITVTAVGAPTSYYTRTIVSAGIVDLDMK